MDIVIKFVILIVGVVFTIFGSVLTGYAAPWLKASADDKQQQTLWDFIKRMVKAAEQIKGENVKGAVKKAYVIERLVENGYDAKDEAIQALRRAAVAELRESEAAVSDFLVSGFGLPADRHE